MASPFVWSGQMTWESLNSRSGTIRRLGWAIFWTLVWGGLAVALLAITLSLFRHVRHSYRPHTLMLVSNATGRWTPTPAMSGEETERGLIVYRFGADLFYANINRFVDEVRALVKGAPTPIRRFIVDAGAITDLDYSAAQAIRELIDELTSQKIQMIFARVNPYLRSDMDRHRLTAAIGETWIFTTLHEAIAAARGSVPGGVQIDN